MTDYELAFKEFNAAYSNVTGVLAIETNLFQDFVVYFDRNTFDSATLPFLFNGFNVSMIDVRKHLELQRGILSKLDRTFDSSDIENEIKKTQILVDKIDVVPAKHIIFLDIDGVLNSDDYWETEARKQESEGMSDAQIMLIAHHIHLDPAAILLINELVDRSGATVVLSSTWRIKYSPIELTQMMEKRGATFKISASTPTLFGKISERIPRGKEIAAYLKSLTVQPVSFVILDDHDDMLDLKNRLVKTTMKHGITLDHIETALNILNGEVK